MPSFVFCFRPDPSLRPAAMESLRARLPAGAAITPKTQTVVAVDVPETVVIGKLEDMRREFGEAWDIYAPTYAEIQPPRLNLAAFRKKTAL